MQILEARNEHEAISLIQNNALDIVITDIALDEGGGTVHGGIKIMESIVTMNIKPKIIAITAHRGFRYQEKGNFETGVFDKAKELGAFACLLSSDDDFLMKLDETIDSL
jgi:YesN/AraC family two-component response regulator